MIANCLSYNSKDTFFYKAAQRMQDHGGPLKLVWAKCSGYPSYPALVSECQCPLRTRLHTQRVELPRPPQDVLRAGERMQFRSAEKLFLVHFFDSRRSWQWLPRSKMAPFGINQTLDRMKLKEARCSSIRKAVRLAFERAMDHLNRVSSEHELSGALAVTD
uniref:Bromodomain containing 1b n=1 Tax=Labrus bergylta TaxID=56723 RepID=A0A3Q3LD30_9LABR